MLDARLRGRDDWGRKAKDFFTASERPCQRSDTAKSRPKEVLFDFDAVPPGLRRTNPLKSPECDGFFFDAVIFCHQLSAFVIVPAGRRLGAGSVLGSYLFSICSYISLNVKDNISSPVPIKKFRLFDLGQGCPAARRLGCPSYSTTEGFMTTAGISFLSLVIGSMAVFAAVMIWATKQSDSVHRR